MSWVSSPQVYKPVITASPTWFTAPRTCPSPVLRWEVAYCKYVKNTGQWLPSCPHWWILILRSKLETCWAIYLLRRCFTQIMLFQSCNWKTCSCWQASIVCHAISLLRPWPTWTTFAPLLVFFTGPTSSFLWVRGVGSKEALYVSVPERCPNPVHEAHFACMQVCPRWHCAMWAWVPLQLFWQKLILKHVARLTDLPGDRLVKKAFAHSSLHQTLWWQKLVSYELVSYHAWLAQHRFEGLLAEGAFSASNAVMTLRDDWFSSVCQSPATKTSCYIDNMFFESTRKLVYTWEIIYRFCNILIVNMLRQHHCHQAASIHS